MNLSLFNIVLGNKKHSYVINAKRLSVIQEIKYFIDERYTADPSFIGTVSNEAFVLRKTIKMLNIPLDFSYKVIGKFEEKSNKCHINYRLTFINYSFKHLSVCILPTLILVYIFLHYRGLYLLVPLAYFFISDLIFNLRKYSFHERNNKNF